MTDKPAAAHANQAMVLELNLCICLAEFTAALLAVSIIRPLLVCVSVYTFV